MPDIEKVVKALENCKEGGSCDGCQYDTNTSRCIFRLHEDALALLKEQPQIVRCKDCKWNNGYTGCDKYLLPHGGDWFCADGEKR